MMSTFFMLGKYSSESIRDISADRTEKSVSLIKELGGKIHSMYALLGEHDLALIVDFPKNDMAMKASLGLSVLTGVAFSTFPAIAVKDFDKMIAK